MGQRNTENSDKVLEDRVETVLIKRGGETMQDKMDGNFEALQPESETVSPLINTVPPFAMKSVIQEASVTAYTNTDDGQRKNVFAQAKTVRTSDNQMNL